MTMFPDEMVVVGGGIAGLAAAYYALAAAKAQDRPLRLTLLESSERWGGKIATDRGEGFVIEGGPDTFLATKPWGVALCRELGLDGRVTFFGWRQDLAAVYGDLDVVVNASRNEGTPVALIEALAAARPVVATRVGGTPDLLGEGERGRLVPPGRPEEIARAVLETLDQSEAARRRAQAGREHVLARHSADRLVRDVDALYRELRAAKKAA